MCGGECVGCVQRGVEGRSVEGVCREGGGCVERGGVGRVCGDMCVCRGEECVGCTETCVCVCVCV